MHATIRHYQGTASRDGELAQAVRHLATRLSQVPGFVSFLVLEAESDVIASISIFEDRESLAEADRLAVALLAEYLATVLPEYGQVTTGEVVFQRGL